MYDALLRIWHLLIRVMRWVIGPAEMHPSFVTLFEDANDFQLIDAVTSAIPEYSDHIPRPQRVAREAWHASGLIGNGGFYVFLGARENVEDTLDILEEFGAAQSADALRLALSIFPESIPQPELDARRSFLENLNDSQHLLLDAAESQYYRGATEHLRKLADYVRENVASFRGLRPGWVAQRYLQYLRPVPAVNATAREIGQWILGLQGHVTCIDSVGEMKFFNQANTSLPQGKLEIVEVGLSYQRRDVVETLTHLANCDSVKGTIQTICLEKASYSAGIVHALGNFPALTEVDLSEANVENADLRDLAQLSLRSLALSKTRVTDQGLRELTSTETLEKLCLDRTSLTIACLQYLCCLPNLIEVVLPRELLVDANMQRLRELTTLRRLDLSGGSVTDSGLVEVAKLNRLESLRLDECKISDAGLKALLGMSELKQLSLRYIGITDAGIKHLESVTSLESLDLISTHVTSGCFLSLSKLVNLKDLQLDSTRVSDEGFEQLAVMRQLEALGLYETDVQDPSMTTIGKLTNLKQLCISNTPVTDQGFAKLSNLKSLEDLSFGETTITDKSIPVIGRFTKIRLLHMSSKISDEGKKVLRRLLQNWQAEGPLTI